MAGLRSIFLIELVVFMVIANTTRADSRWHSNNRAAAWKNNYAQSEYGQLEIDRQKREENARAWKDGVPQLPQQNSGHLAWINGNWVWVCDNSELAKKAKEWKDGAPQQNSGHLEWINGLWVWVYDNSKLETRANSWKNSISQRESNYRPRINRGQVEQQAEQWKNSAGYRSY